MLLEHMESSSARLVPHYGWSITDLRVEPSGDHPVWVDVTSTTEPSSPPRPIRAKYVVGCDGARSTVRRLIGRELVGDSANQAWGVIDVLAVTDFPDVRFKSVIQSAAGNMIIIPREGDQLFRMYVELDALAPEERVRSRQLTSEDVLGKAREILSPHRLDVKKVVWWSVYEVGQRLTDRFDNIDPEKGGSETPRVFIAGDACHTHSPKAGQGMNVSMQDAFNLG